MNPEFHSNRKSNYIDSEHKAGRKVGGKKTPKAAMTVLFAGITAAIVIPVVGLHGDAGDDPTIHLSKRLTTHQTTLTVASKTVVNDEDDTGEDSGDSISLGDGWYTDIPADTKAGSKKKSVGIFDFYSGLPWKADSHTYFFNFPKAKEDIAEIFRKAGDEPSSSSSMFVNSAVGGVPTTHDVDGKNCVVICVQPTFIDRSYVPDHAMLAGCVDDATHNYKYKIAMVFVPKGEDVTNEKKFLYVPATRGDAKAHTFYGGVVQTNCKLADSVVEASINNSGSSHVDIPISPDDDPVKILKQCQQAFVSSGAQSSLGIHISAWFNNWFEVYNMSSSTLSEVANSYDVAGVVIWGDSLGI